MVRGRTLLSVSKLVSRCYCELTVPTADHLGKPDLGSVFTKSSTFFEQYERVQCAFSPSFSLSLLADDLDTQLNWPKLRSHDS